MNRYVAASEAVPGGQRKLCLVCGATIVWRRRLAATWNEVQYCSAACRRVSAARARAAGGGEAQVYDGSGDNSVASAA